MRRFFYIFFASLLTSCAHLKEIPAQQYVAPPKSDLATIYLYRTNSMPTKANVEFKVDNTRVALLPDDSFTWIKVQPGQHILAASYDPLLGLTARLPITVEPRKTYAIQYQGQASGGTGYPLYGNDGKVIGYVDSDRKAWTKLEEFPIDQINDLVLYTKFVFSTEVK